MLRFCHGFWRTVCLLYEELVWTHHLRGLVLALETGSNASSSSSSSALSLKLCLLVPCLPVPKTLACDSVKLSVVCLPFVVAARGGGFFIGDVALRVLVETAVDFFPRVLALLLLSLKNMACESSSSSSSSSSMTTSSSSLSSSSSSSSTTFFLALLDAAAGFLGAAVVFVVLPLAPPLVPLPRPLPLAGLGFGVSSSSSSSPSITLSFSSSGLSRAPGWSSQSPSRSLSQLLGFGLNRCLPPLLFFKEPLENISSS